MHNRHSASGGFCFGLGLSWRPDSPPCPIPHSSRPTCSGNYSHTPTSFPAISCMCIPEVAQLHPKMTPSHEFSPDFLHVCPRSSRIQPQNDTVTRVFAVFLVGVSPIKPIIAPKRHCHTTFRRISCMCIRKRPCFRPLSTHTHLRVFPRFLACIPQSLNATSIYLPP